MKPRFVLSAFALFVALRSADAHDPGFSTAVVTVGAREIEAVVTYATREVADPVNEPAFLINDNVPGTPIRELEGEDDNSIFILKMPRPADGGVALSAPLLDHLAPGHRQHLLIRDEEKAVLMNRFLHRGESVATLSLTPLDMPRNALGMFPLIESLALALIAVAFFFAFRRPPRFRSQSPPDP